MSSIEKKKRTSASPELVNKTETSRPRLNAQRKIENQKRCQRQRRVKLNAVLKQQRRIANSCGLRAIALTLNFSANSRFSMKEISKFLGRVRKWLKRKNSKARLAYLWTFESAGRLHYHLLIWIPRGMKLSHEDLKKWWPLGSTHCEHCRNVSKWASYLCKSQTKTNLPQGARSYGYGGLDALGKAEVARTAQPIWLQKKVGMNANLVRFPGGGWCDLDTGEIHLSPFHWTPKGFVARS